MGLKKITLTEILIHAFSLILIFLAGYYYLERTLPFDGAFYSFRISETGWFCIDNYRYGVRHTQMLPLLLLKAGCSLKVFLISYSISFALCNYIICMVVLYVYKQPGLAMALLFATALSYTYKFFYPVSEIHSTVAPLFLFAAHVFRFENRRNNVVYFLVAALLITWFLFIHLISIIPAFFILAYYASISKPLKKSLPVVIFSALFLGLAFMLSKTFLSTQYLESKMIGIKELIKFLSDPNAAPGYTFFKNEFLFNYLPLEAAYVIAVVFLLLKKEFLQIATLLVFTIGTWLIIMAYNLNPDAPIVYMNYYGLFGFYIAFPFCLYVADYIHIKKFAALYAFLLICSIVGIVRSGALITDQVNYYKRVTTNMKTPKAIVHPTNVDWTSVWMGWDLSFQSLLVSALETPLQEKTFFNTDDPDLIKKQNLLKDEGGFFNTPFSPTWFRPPFKNTAYYSLLPAGYVHLNSIQDSLQQDSFLSSKSIEILLADDKTMYLLKNNDRTIPITVVNHNQFLLPSIPGAKKQINLSYHVYDSKNELYIYKGKRSHLEADIQPNGSILTGLSVDCTQMRRGRTYYIDADLVIENKRWLGIKKRIKIVLI